MSAVESVASESHHLSISTRTRGSCVEVGVAWAATLAALRACSGSGDQSRMCWGLRKERQARRCSSPAACVGVGELSEYLCCHSAGAVGSRNQ